jgi:hypothetical protein
MGSRLGRPLGFRVKLAEDKFLTLTGDVKSPQFEALGMTPNAAISGRPPSAILLRKQKK